MGPFLVLSTGPGTYHVDFLTSMAVVYLWFNTSLLKPAGPQLSGLPELEDNSYEVEAML